MTLNPAPLVAIQSNRIKSKAQRIVLLIANAPIIHGVLPSDLAAQDWAQAVDQGQCALWLLGHDMQFLAMPSVDLALEWLYYVGSADHGMWPEQGMIPYPAGELARMAEA